MDLSVRKEARWAPGSESTCSSLQAPTRKLVIEKIPLRLGGGGKKEPSAQLRKDGGYVFQMWTQAGAVSSFLHLQISPEKGWRGALVGLLALGDAAGLAQRRGVTWVLIWLAVQPWPGGRN